MSFTQHDLATKAPKCFAANKFNQAAWLMWQLDHCTSRWCVLILHTHIDRLNQMNSLSLTRHQVDEHCSKISIKCTDDVTFSRPCLGRLMLQCTDKEKKKQTLQSTINDKRKKKLQLYTELSVVSITPTTIRSSVMRRHSLSTWGFEDTAGMSCVLLSEASSFDSSSQSHRVIRPSWT